MFKLIFAFGIILFVLTGIFAWRYFDKLPPEPEISVNSNHNPDQTINQNSNLNSNSLLDKKTRKDSKLQSESDSLLNLFGKFPSVPIYVRDEPILKKGSETQKGVGYTTCQNSNQPTIFIKKAFYEKANQKQLTNILKHELVHAWFCRQGIQNGHDERFRKKFSEVGGFGN